MKFLPWLLATLDVVELTAGRDRPAVIAHFNTDRGLAALHRAWKRGDSPQAAAARTIADALAPRAA